MRYYPQIEQKYPFVIAVIATISVAVYTVFSYIISSPEYLLLIKVPMLICFALMLFCSIRTKRYLYIVFFAFLIVTCTPFLKIGHYETTQVEVYMLPWDFMNILIFLIFIFVCYSFYPQKKVSQ